jgi:AcrR family transcriptional regulator
LVALKNETSDNAEPRKHGARLARTRRTVLEGAAAIVVEKGVAAFTIDEVVERTGVALSTIYRHWRTRNELLSEAIIFAAEPRSVPDTGSTRGDLLEFLSWRTRHLADHWDVNMQTLPGLVGAARHNPDIAGAVTSAVGKVLDCLRIILERGQKRGDVRSDRDIDAMADILLGALFIRGGYRGKKASNAYLTSAIDTIIEGIGATGAPKRPARGKPAKRG